jgi:predicted nucleotidyltransferase
MNKTQAAVLQTLAYADVFDYPLTLEELQKFLIGQKIDNQSLKKSLKALKKISSKRNYFFLRNREVNINQREKRKKWSQKKWLLVQKVASWLRIIPWIKMVAVTGNLAMDNADQDDDIDLLIIASEKRLWLARLFTNFLVEIVANRRRPGDKEVKDKICLNMFLDEKHLKIPDKEQNLFTAHEVCQLKPLWVKNQIYQKFIQENLWWQKFLPNWKA